VEELDRIARSAGCLRSDLVRQALRLGLITLTALNEQETNQ
jgi:metal-responsive CopG/Arc/MetJ family transcriptional regulator